MFVRKFVRKEIGLIKDILSVKTLSYTPFCMKGIQRMVSACLKQKLPELDYQIWADVTIVIVFPRRTL